MRSGVRTVCRGKGLCFRDCAVTGRVFSLVSFIARTAGARVRLFNRVGNVSMGTRGVGRVTGVGAHQLVGLLSDAGGVTAFVQGAFQAGADLLGGCKVGTRVGKGGRLILPAGGIIRLGHALRFLGRSVFENVVASDLCRSGSGGGSGHWS